MNQAIRKVFLLTFCFVSVSLSALEYKADRLRKAVEKTGACLSVDSLMPDTTISVKTKDGRTVCIRTNPMGCIEHIGVPLFNDAMRFLLPSPVYDFLEYAVLNWKYKVYPNQLYLSKVIFKKGNWNTLLTARLHDCSCTIENMDDKLYVVTWQKDNKDVAQIGVPIEYELLNNDTRRNMEKDYLKQLTGYHPTIHRPKPSIIDEDDLSIYGTEGLFVNPGKSYLVDLLNQNVYYKLTTVYETVDTIISKKPATITIEAVQPVVACDPEFPAETFANLMMCNDTSFPDAIMELDFHLSTYHREHITIPLSHLKAFCRQEGCELYFACDGVVENGIRGVMFANNRSKGYNHLFGMHIAKDQLLSDSPTVHADVYLYIPHIDKEKLFGIAPEKKSGFKFKLP